MGWLPDYPDFRDYTPTRDEVAPRFSVLGQKRSVRDMLAKVGVAEPRRAGAPAKADLREWCSPVEDQGALGSCTANAGVGLVEYYARRAFGRHIDASRLFLYKASRNLLHWSGDTGAFIRTAMGALVLFGVPPEEHWPYKVESFDKEPTAFCYAFAQDYHAIQYYRLDPPDTSKEELLKQVRAYIAAGLPAMFGFTVYSSIDTASEDGRIPFPTEGERVVGGHAICAVGYDDKMRIKDSSGKRTTTGALLIRNSWGEGWGEKGYGWLPYEYVTRGLAVDWWSLLKNEWVDTGQFGQ
jgi:C1A family cysteine protease